MVRDMVVAANFGAGWMTDAFYVAFKIPNLLRRLLAEGSLTTAFVPVFSEELKHGPERTRRALGASLSFTLILSSICASLGIIFADEITLIFAPGFGIGTEKTILANHLLKIMFPYVTLVSVTALVSGVLNTLGYFAIPAAGPVVLNLVLIIGIYMRGSFFDPPITVLAWSVLLGGAVCLAQQLWGLKIAGYGFRLYSPFSSPAVKRLVTLMLPTVLSSSIYQLMIFLNTLLASMFGEGSVSFLYYADRLFQFPLGVFSVALGTALLPALAKAAVDQNEKSFRHQLSRAIEWTGFVTIPATVGLITLSHPLVQLIYQHGAFTPESTNQTARSLEAFSIGLWAASCQSILVRAFLARQNSKIPAIVSSCSMLVNVLLAFVLMGTPTMSADSTFAAAILTVQNHLALFSLGHVGLALAGSLATFFPVIALWMLLPKLGSSVESGPVFRSFVIQGASAALMWGALKVVLALTSSAWVQIAVAVPVGGLAFFLAAWMLRAPEAQLIAAAIGKYLRKKSA